MFELYGLLNQAKEEAESPIETVRMRSQYIRNAASLLEREINHGFDLAKKSGVFPFPESNTIKLIQI
jgi:hypothetical protein